MGNERFGKKIAAWFLEEEKEEAKNVEARIELSLWQVVMLAGITVLFIIWIFYSNSRNNDFLAVLTPPEFIAKKIEKNYFDNNRGIINGDFSRGQDHWKTSDGGRLFPGSKSRAFLNEKDYHSAPGSLEIQTIVPANRYYYVKKTFDGIFQNPYNYQSNLFWLGVPAGGNIDAGLWYKGDILTLYLQGLTKDGEWVGLGNVSGAASDTWNKLAIKKQIPDNIRAIGIEITLNQAKGAPLPRVLIDDVSVVLSRKDAE